MLLFKTNLPKSSSFIFSILWIINCHQYRFVSFMYIHNLNGTVSYFLIHILAILFIILHFQFLPCIHQLHSTKSVHLHTYYSSDSSGLPLLLLILRDDFLKKLHSSAYGFGISWSSPFRYQQSTQIIFLQTLVTTIINYSQLIDNSYSINSNI